MAISSEWAGPPVEWAGLPVSPTLPYLRVSKLCFMRPGEVCQRHIVAHEGLGIVLIVRDEWILTGLVRGGG